MRSVNFIDSFSEQSYEYAKFRPTYPRKLFRLLHRASFNHTTAWDCATGNGQAAIDLTSFFKQVNATDASQQQILNARPHRRIFYVNEMAEQTSIKSNSVDLITVANALHWFDIDRFYVEVRRVLRRQGCITVWSYGIPSISPEIDALVKVLHDQILKEYWLAQNMHIETKYEHIPFPFSSISTPEFTICKKVTFNEFIGFLSTWSAAQHYKNSNKRDPILTIFDDLVKVWGNISYTKIIRWKLILKIGYNYLAKLKIKEFVL